MSDSKSELLCDCDWHDFCFVLFKKKKKKRAKNNIIPMSLSFFQSVFSERLFSIT